MGGLGLKFGCLGFGFILVIIGAVLLGTGRGNESRLEQDKRSHQIQAQESVLDVNYTNATCYNIIIKSNQPCFDFDFTVGYIVQNLTVLTKKPQNSCYDLSTDCQALLTKIEDSCQPIYYFDYNVTGWSYDEYTSGGFGQQVEDLIGAGIGLLIAGGLIAFVAIMHPCKEY